MDSFERLVNALKASSDYKVICLWNECAYAGNYIRVYHNGPSFFREMFGGYATSDVVQRIFCGKFNPAHDYIYTYGYDVLVTFQHHSDKESPVDYEILAEYLLESYFCGEIEENLGVKIFDYTD